VGEDGVGKIVAEFWVGGGEQGAQFAGEGVGGFVVGDGVVLFGDGAPEIAVVLGLCCEGWEACGEED
jgi:hypothetical protein